MKALLVFLHDGRRDNVRFSPLRDMKITFMAFKIKFKMNFKLLLIGVDLCLTQNITQVYFDDSDTQSYIPNSLSPSFVAVNHL